MYTEALPLLKARLGISTSARDEYLKAIIEGLEDELLNIQGLTLDTQDSSHLMFIVDYAEYRYSNRGNPTMPRHLQWRLHNLMLNGGASNV